MMKNTLHYQIAIGFLDGVGIRTAKNLIAHFGSIEPIFDLPLKELMKEVPGFSKERIRKLNRSEALRKAEDQLDFTLKYNLGAHYYLDENYPERLKNCCDAPIVLFSKGNFDLNPARCVAVVGTRKVTDYGKRIAEELIEELAPFGVQVVSGLAFGVDSLAHRYALKQGLSTVGVLGHGLDRLYPAQHKELAHKMVAEDGGLLSEFVVGTNPDRENFPKRNRIVAGMTDATIVVESGSKGGSLITAHLANDYSRDVFAYPGNIFHAYSEGCNSLIANDKAHLVSRPAQIIEMLNWRLTDKKPVQRQFFVDLTEEEENVVNILKDKNIASIDQLSGILQQKVSQLSSCLLNLELVGIVASLPGKNYKLVQ